jgi:hypothetical protein
MTALVSTLTNCSCKHVGIRILGGTNTNNTCQRGSSHLGFVDDYRLIMTYRWFMMIPKFARPARAPWNSMNSMNGTSIRSTQSMIFHGD